MKEILFFTALVITWLDASCTDKINLAGHWEGALIREGSAQLLKLDFGMINDSIYGTYDDLSIEVYEAPFLIKFNNDTIVLSRFGYGEFKCLLNTDKTEISGIGTSWDPVVKIHLKKVGRKEPSLFIKEDITYKSNSTTIHGSLLRPVNKQSYPLIILLHGAGYAGRDAPYYHSIAYKLAQNDIGVFYYDQRGYGKSKGDLEVISLMDTYGDALAAIKYLKKRKNIPYTKLGILGHSRGGWLAAMLASKKGIVDFVVLHAGSARSVYEQDIDRVKYSLQHKKATTKVVDSAISYQLAYFDYISGKLSWENLKYAISQTKYATWLNYVSIPKNKEDEDIKWWRRYKYDPSHDLCKIKAPVLSIFGEEDILVHPEVNKPLMEKYLGQAGIPFDISIIPKATHSMQIPDYMEGASSSYPDGYWVWRKKAAIYYPTIINWIFKHL